MKIWRSTTCILSLLVLLVSSCQITAHEAPELPEPALALYVGHNAWDCQQAGDSYTFSLPNASRNQPAGAGIPNDMSYYVYLPGTPLYSLPKECMCKMKYFNFEFDDLPPAALIRVRGLNGQTIPFSGPYATTNGHEEIRIQDKYLQTGVFVGFDPAVQPEPILRYTGGFCIVDNISAPVDQVEDTYMTAYIEPASDPNSQEEYHEIFLPVRLLWP